MKLILGTGIPPWMDYLFEEYETHKGLNEDTSPLKERIIEYHNSGSSKGNTHVIPWCASFVNWCFDQTVKYKNINSGLNSYAFDWGPEGNKLALDKRNSLKGKPKGLSGWKEGEECEAFVGAVVVLSYSHCAFIIGFNEKDNKYVYIGGNQGDAKISGAQQIKYGTVRVGKEFAIMKPKNYKIESYDLPKFTINADGSYDSTR